MAKNVARNKQHTGEGRADDLSPMSWIEGLPTCHSGNRGGTMSTPFPFPNIVRRYAPYILLASNGYAGAAAFLSNCIHLPDNICSGKNYNDSNHDRN